MHDRGAKLPPMVLAIALFCAALIDGCGSGGWQHKATLSANAASNLVGGFSGDDGRLYRLGIQHVINLHQHVGAFTIGQIIDQERQRESDRARARVLAAEQRRDAASTSGLLGALKAANTLMQTPLYSAGKITNDGCSVTIDGDLYQNAGDQDQALIKQTVVSMCVAAFKELGRESRPLPSNGLAIALYNLAGDAVYTDTATEDLSTVPTARPKIAIDHADPRGAYKVLEHWEVPCSGHGGFGEKVMVLSHRQADLTAAYHRWMQEHAPDKSQCIDFYVFASAQSYDAFDHTSNYTDAQLASIPNGLQYTNNPNTGYEGWTDPDGNEHVLHAAQQ